MKHVYKKDLLLRNALGSHWDGEDPELRNVENECYCMEDKGCQILFIFISITRKTSVTVWRMKIYSATGFPCFKSGVMNMGPCKTTESLPTGAPIALSAPHFYQVTRTMITFILHFCVV